MKIAVIAHFHYPIAEPFHGGLEMQTHLLVTELMQRGHQVTLFALAASDPDLNALPLESLTIPSMKILIATAAILISVAILRNSSTATYAYWLVFRRAHFVFIHIIAFTFYPLPKPLPYPAR